MRLRTKVKLINGSWSVDLPSYVMVSGSFLPLTTDAITPDGVVAGIAGNDIRVEALSCEVDIPEADIDPQLGIPTVAVLRERYKGNPKWDVEALVLDPFVIPLTI